MFLQIAERSRVAEARRLAIQVSTAQGFNEKDAGRVAIVATELATNLVKHADGGEIVISSFDDAEGRGLELLALDKGPGIVDLNRALDRRSLDQWNSRHGAWRHSSKRRRFCRQFQGGRGTAVLARLKPDGQAAVEGECKANI